jgi:lysophospholipase L1-like esterase
MRLAAAAVAFLLIAGSASAAQPVTRGSRYLALGDSVTFGYEEPGVVPTPNYSNPATLLGYPEQLGAELHLIVANAACPGETTDSLINANAASNGCENVGGSGTGYRKLFPLHVRYRGSQLAYAVAYLKAHPDVRLVSLMIGANDLFRCQATTADGCSGPGELQRTLAHIARNVRKILSAIRNRAHYDGQLAIVNYYSLNYASALVSGISRSLNAAVDGAAKPFHVEIGDGFGAFKLGTRRAGGDPCAARLLTFIPSAKGCGIHPSYAGQALLAQALEKAIKL